MFKLLKTLLGFGDFLPGDEPVRRPSYVFAWEDQRFPGIEHQPVDSLLDDAHTFARNSSFHWLRNMSPGRSSSGDRSRVLVVTVADRLTADDEHYPGTPEKYEIDRKDLIEAYRDARHDKHLCCDDQMELAGLGAGCVYDFSVILQYACYGEGLFGTDGYGRDF